MAKKDVETHRIQNSANEMCVVVIIITITTTIIGVELQDIFKGLRITIVYLCS